MNYEDYVLYGIVIAVVGVLVYSLVGFSGIGTGQSAYNQDTAPVAGSGFGTVSTGSTGQGDVSVDLTPVGVVGGKLEVDIAVNTHSVDLSQFDLKKIITLEYAGKSVNPISVPVLAGHHNNGKLVFDVGEKIDKFAIKIKGIPKVEDRVFSW